MEIFTVLNHLDIPYQKFEHEPVYTCKEANGLPFDIPGSKTKNLFLRDRKGQRHFLVVILDNKQLDLSVLSKQLNATRLRFASPARLQTYLSTTPGSVSILNVMDDPNGLVELVIDKDIWLSTSLQCHPLINTATLVIFLRDIKKLFAYLNRTATLIQI